MWSLNEVQLGKVEKKGTILLFDEYGTVDVCTQTIYNKLRFVVKKRNAYLWQYIYKTIWFVYKNPIFCIHRAANILVHFDGWLFSVALRLAIT